jgi:cardiolipin synthase A/B
MKTRWLPGNKVRLLENGEAFYPAVFDAIRSAQSEVLIETFIIFEDKVGLELHQVLLEAAQRGVKINLLFDGFGTADLSVGYLGALTSAGVDVRAFDPSVRLFGWRFNVMRRMHRKLVAIDNRIAFCGGLNFSADHLADFGPQGKQDYAVELEGPIVGEIRAFMKSVLKQRTFRQAWQERRAWRRHRNIEAVSVGSAEAMLVTRDNTHHPNDIERHYRAAIRAARKRVIIANAYFFPGYRLLRELRRAARRGVDVQLILQGEPDVPMARAAAQWLYEYLRRGGVKIYEYCERPIHAKVAVVDDEWATVGSSNLDPLSLSLNLEANVVLRDREFNSFLTARLQHLVQHGCTEIEHWPQPRWGWLGQLRATVVFHFLRKFPSWASLLPRHEPKLAPPVGAPEPAPQPPLVGENKACHAR